MVDTSYFLEDPPPEGFTSTPRDLEALIDEHLQPWALLRKEATDVDADDPGIRCLDIGKMMMTDTGNFRFVETRGVIIQIRPAIQVGMPRRIFMDQKHPDNPPLTWDGHSVGHWDADTLVVDSIGFNDKSPLHAQWFQPHTSELRVVERYRLVADGDYMEYKVTVSDRKALKSPYSYTRYFKRTEDPSSYDACNPSPKEVLRWYRMWQAAMDRATAAQ
ncbi:MAG: hypothetical protein QM696_01035 [Steroidobacteraceae bacterium]